MSFEFAEISPVIIYWDFNPYHPVRADRTREVIFIKEWQKLMTAKAIDEVNDGCMREDRYFIENESWRYPVLDIFDFTPTAQQTRLAGNFILYLAQWALDNNPVGGMAVNMSARTWCLQRDQKTFIEPELTDIKVLERMTYWCGTAKGQAFLQICESAATQSFQGRQSAKLRHIP